MAHGEEPINGALLDLLDERAAQSEKRSRSSATSEFGPRAGPLAVREYHRSKRRQRAEH